MNAQGLSFLPITRAKRVRERASFPPIVRAYRLRDCRRAKRVDRQKNDLWQSTKLGAPKRVSESCNRVKNERACTTYTVYRTVSAIMNCSSNSNTCTSLLLLFNLPVQLLILRP
jgi:hypothetical protein